MRCADCGEVTLSAHHFCDRKNIKHKNLGCITFDFLEPAPVYNWDQLISVICSQLEGIVGIKNIHVREEE